MAKPRSCGTCSVCCITPRIAEFDKPKYARCSHLSETKGCGNYEARPEVCQKFRCLWLAGNLDSFARPDRLGVLFFASANNDPTGKTVNVLECHKGALDQPVVIRILRAMSAQNFVLIVSRYRDDQEQFLGRPEDVVRVKRHLKILASEDEELDAAMADALESA